MKRRSPEFSIIIPVSVLGDWTPLRALCPPMCLPGKLYRPVFIFFHFFNEKINVHWTLSVAMVKFRLSPK